MRDVRMLWSNVTPAFMTMYGMLPALSFPFAVTTSDRRIASKLLNGRAGVSSNR